MHRFEDLPAFVRANRHNDAFLVGIELTKFAKDIRLNKDLIPMAVTVIVSLATNMAYGFLVGLIVYHLIRFVFRKKGCSAI